MEERVDKTIICRNCGKEFVFTAGEQRFFEEKGLKPPVRCKECKAKRKAEQAEREAAAQENNFEQNNHSHQEKPEKTAEEKNKDFEEMLNKFRENTILFEQEKEKHDKKRK